MHDGIPKIIYQIVSDKSNILDQSRLFGSDYVYKILDYSQCSKFVLKYFPQYCDLYDKLDLPSQILICKFMIIYMGGGICIDQSFVKSCSIPPLPSASHLNKSCLIVELNQTQYTTRVLLSTPNHPLLHSTITNYMNGLSYSSRTDLTDIWNQNLYNYDSPDLFQISCNNLNHCCRKKYQKLVDIAVLCLIISLIILLLLFYNYSCEK